MGLGRDDAAIQQQKMGPQRETKWWNRVKPSGQRPPVTGIPPEVEALLYLRQTGVKYEVHTPQYVYF